MKKLLLLTILLITGFAKAQQPNYDDLRILYADGNYKKLLKEAENYTLKEKTKGDALPHMWLGRALYKIDQTGAAEGDLKNAYKDASGSLGKAVKLDTDSSVRTAHAEFFDEFKMSLLERMMNDISQPNGHKKAVAWVLKYYKLEPGSLGAKYMEGACKFRNADKGGANLVWKEAESKLSKTTSIENWSKADKELLKQGVLQTADCYVSTRQTEKAKALLGKVAQWFEGDEEFKAKYSAIVG